MPSFKIKKLSAREILDSRAEPTLEVRLELTDGNVAKASVPSGASTGKFEAWELRDKDPRRYSGKGVLKAAGNVNTILARTLRGKDVRDQLRIDEIMKKVDGTLNKRKLGANAILGVSLACARTAAMSAKLPLYRYLRKCFAIKETKYILPIPMFNIFNGGKHADTNLDFQEFMVIPEAEKQNTGKAKPSTFKEKVRHGSEVFHALGKVLKERGFDTDVGNEGGYAPDIFSSVQALEMILAAIIRAGLTPGVDMSLGIDVGSSILYNEDKKRYIFRLDQAAFSNITLVGLYYEWFRTYPIIYLEDGLGQDDWEGWQELTELLGEEMMVVGDDLFVTNTARLKKGIEKRVANGIIIKPNQIGTLTETVACVNLAKKNNYQVIVSHRSGETTDDFIADLAVACGADHIKAGAPSRGERVAKYNRLMEIEEELKLG
ncbi:MAG: phosphopyruvate hydratase [bacterium]